MKDCTWWNEWSIWKKGSGTNSRRKNGGRRWKTKRQRCRAAHKSKKTKNASFWTWVFNAHTELHILFYLTENKERLPPSKIKKACYFSVLSLLIVQKTKELWALWFLPWIFHASRASCRARPCSRTSPDASLLFRFQALNGPAVISSCVVGLNVKMV